MMRSASSLEGDVGGGGGNNNTCNETESRSSASASPSSSAYPYSRSEECSWDVSEAARRLSSLLLSTPAGRSGALGNASSLSSLGGIAAGKPPWSCRPP